MYGLLFGKNPNTEVVLALLGLKECDVERFRDCGIDAEAKRIYVYTRTGGGNREDYPNQILRDNPLFDYDCDDESDCTYATFYFKFPEDLGDRVLEVANPRERGISKEVIARICDAIEREPNERDLFRATYEKQQRLCENLRRTLDLYETNGWVVVPMNDSAMRRLLESAEEADGEFHPMSIRVFKLFAETEVPQWSHRGEMARVKISLGKDWTFDRAAWERYEGLFSEKFPKAWAKLAESHDYIIKKNAGN